MGTGFCEALLGTEYFEVGSDSFLFWIYASLWLYGTIHVRLRETCEAALNQQRALDMSRTEEPSQEAYASHTERLKALDRVFERAAEDDKPTEVH